MKKLQSFTFLLCTIFMLGFTSPNIIAQPSNDLISDAIGLEYGPLPYTENDIDFPNATFLEDSTPAPCGVGVSGIWYVFTATAAGTIEAIIEQPDNAIVLFFEGPRTAESGQELTYIDQPGNPCLANPSASIATTVGSTYFIYMKNDIVSEITIDTEQIFSAPANDLIENATNVNGTNEYIDYSVHSLMATSIDDGGQLGCDANGTPMMWYKFTAEKDGEVLAGAASAPNETVVIFYSAPNENVAAGTDLTYVDQVTNICGTSNISAIQAAKGTTYYLGVATLEPFVDIFIDTTEVLGIDENNFNSFTYYPNPANNELNYKADINIESVTVFNVLGQQVLTQTIQASQGQLRIDELQSGMYILNVTSEGKTQSYKFIKQ